MGELYQGCLKNQDLNEGLEELRKVRKELKNFSPSDVIWDAEDLSLTPPWEIILVQILQICLIILLPVMEEI